MSIETTNDAGETARESPPAPLNDAQGPSAGPRTLEEALGQMTDYQVQLLGFARRHVPALGFMLDVRGLVEEALARHAETRARVEKVEEALGAFKAGLDEILEAVRRLPERGGAWADGEAPGDGDARRVARVNLDLLESNAALTNGLRVKEEQFLAFVRAVGACMRQLDEAAAHAPEPSAEDLRNLRAVFVSKLGNQDFLPIEPKPGAACDLKEHAGSAGAALSGRVSEVVLPGYKWRRVGHEEVLLKAEVRAGGRAGAAPPGLHRRGVEE